LWGRGNYFFDALKTVGHSTPPIALEAPA